MPFEIQTSRFSFGEPPHKVEALVVKMGDDLIVTVGGGIQYHVGAVAVGHVYTSPRISRAVSSTVSVITHPGHKEDEITQAAARKLSKCLNCSVVISAGMHIDNASEKDIQILVDNFLLLIEQIITTFSQKA